MYLPSHFEESRIDVLHDLIDHVRMGALVTIGSDGLNANHVPFELVREEQTLGTLRCHVARNNDVWMNHATEQDSLVIFQGPHAYISPTWYPTKQESHRHVPTYNYVVVHAYGRLRVIDDERWVRGMVARLTRMMEAEEPKPWKMTDAPGDYINQMLQGIVGLELKIDRLLGKWKVSQNRLPVDRAGAAEHLRTSDREDARVLATWIDQLGASLP